MALQAWEQKSRDRLKAFLKKNLKSLESLQSRDAVEADTRTFVTDVFVEGFGFDKYEELTAEYLVRGEFADIGIRVDKKLVAFVEIKRISTDLREMHLRQVKTYAANEGVEWAILTNGRRWQVYHISNSTPIQEVLLLDLDLLNDDTSLAQDVETLSSLSRESMGRNVLSAEWNAIKSLKPEFLWKSILTPAVLAAIRAQLRKETGQLVDAKKLETAVAELRRS
jgi:predicted type IV restriction endonuclease